MSGTSISLAGSCQVWQKGNGNRSGLPLQTGRGALAELDTRGGFPLLWHNFPHKKSINARKNVYMLRGVI